MGFRGRSSGRGREAKESKYLRLTGLWPSKNNDALWTGKFRNQDLVKLIEKCEEADKAGADLVVFLWENKEKDGRKDPDFTVQVSISEDEKSGRGRSSRGSSSRRDRDNDRDDNQDDNQDDQDDNQDDPEPEEEKPRGRKSSKKEEEEKPRSRSGAKNRSTKDKNDW